MKRENGFYWVNFNSEWTVAEYHNGFWSVVAENEPFHDNEISAVDERRSIRKEPEEEYSERHKTVEFRNECNCMSCGMNICGCGKPMSMFSLCDNECYDCRLKSGNEIYK